jgi:hypothetical protein
MSRATIFDGVAEHTAAKRTAAAPRRACSVRRFIYLRDFFGGRFLCGDSLLMPSRPKIKVTMPPIATKILLTAPSSSPRL